MPRPFAIDTENAITAFPAAESVPEGQEHFASEKELAKLAANWPYDRLVSIWNAFAGVAGFGAELKPVKKFTDRKTAIKRIWTAIQKLDGGAPEETTAAPETAAAAPKAAKGAPKKAKTAKAARTKDGAPTAREGTKKQIVIEMLRRKEGTTLENIMQATDWQKHSVRGFLAGTLKKMGLTVESTKENGTRTYHLTK